MPHRTDPQEGAPVERRIAYFVWFDAACHDIFAIPEQEMPACFKISLEAEGLLLHKVTASSVHDATAQIFPEGSPERVWASMPSAPSEGKKARLH